MLLNEFSQNSFIPQDEKQKMLLESIKLVRSIEGLPHRYRILRSLARTRKFTRTVLPNPIAA
jgi:hypothetical protein